MPFQDFVHVYRAKSDEELVQLAAAQEQLSSEAWLALESELSRRQITIEKHPEAFRNDGALQASGGVPGSKRLQPVEWQGVSDFVAEVLRIYHSHFWLFFKITAPAIIIGTAAIITGRNEAREIARHLPRGAHLLAHLTEVFEIWLANLSSLFVSWMASCFSFGAICIALEETEAGFTPSAWHSFRCIRERLGPFLLVSFLLFVLVSIAYAATLVLGIGAVWILHQLRAYPGNLAMSAIWVGLMFVGLLVFSRLALAIPAVVLDDCRIKEAMFRSDRLTGGKWLTLAALLGKSIVGGYIAAMCPLWLVAAIPGSAALPSWFSWILTGLSVIGVTVVEPPMFIGFSLLYLKMSKLDSGAGGALRSQLA